MVKSPDMYIEGGQKMMLPGISPQVVIIIWYIGKPTGGITWYIAKPTGGIT